MLHFSEKNPNISEKRRDIFVEIKAFYSYEIFFRERYAFCFFCPFFHKVAGISDIASINDIPKM